MTSALRWLEQRRLEDLVTDEHLQTWIDEDADAAVIEERFRTAFERIWDHAVKRARDDERTLREAVGEEGARAALDLAEALEPSEESVRAVFEQGATEELLGTVLYDGIMEFLKKADLLGPVIDKIPVIGGLRRRILSGLREEFERRAERQVRAFLKTASKAAVQRAIDFVLSQRNREKFRGMRRRLTERLLDARIRDLVLSDARLERVRKETWERLRDLASDKERWRANVERARSQHGEKTLAGLRAEWALPDLGWRTAPVLRDLWVAFLHEPEAEAWYRAQPLPPR
jgi:hypothetical protein